MTMLPDVCVTNLHRRFTGVSATIEALVPVQRRDRAIAVLDGGGLALEGTIGLRDLLRDGWRRPSPGRFRVWHARRDVEMLLGIVLRHLLRQPWCLVFTSAAPKRPGRMLRWLMRRMDVVVATSQRSAGFLARVHVVVPHGVDCDLFRPADDREAALAEVGLAGQRVIGAFGRLRPSKGTDLFVEAMVRLLPDHPGFTAVLTGLCKDSEAAFKSGMEARIAEAGLTNRILFLGDLPMPEVRRWYQRISLCVAASRSEGFGLTPLEAFASGAAAVTSEAGAWPWIVTPELGARFATGDAGRLTETLRPFLSDPAMLDRLGREARRIAVERHSIEAEAAALNAIYERLAAGERIACYARPSSRAARGAK